MLGSTDELTRSRAALHQAVLEEGARTAVVSIKTTRLATKTAASTRPEMHNPPKPCGVCGVCVRERERARERERRERATPECSRES